MIISDDLTFGTGLMNLIETTHDNPSNVRPQHAWWLTSEPRTENVSIRSSMNPSWPGRSERCTKLRYITSGAMLYLILQLEFEVLQSIYHRQPSIYFTIA